MKLLAAVGAWLGPAQVAMAALATSIAGGVIALAVALGHGYLKTALPQSVDAADALAGHGRSPAARGDAPGRARSAPRVRDPDRNRHGGDAMAQVMRWFEAGALRGRRAARRIRARPSAAPVRGAGHRGVRVHVPALRGHHQRRPRRRAHGGAARIYRPRRAGRVSSAYTVRAAACPRPSTNPTVLVENVSIPVTGGRPPITPSASR